MIKEFKKSENKDKYNDYLELFNSSKIKNVDDFILNLRIKNYILKRFETYFNIFIPIICIN